MINCLKVNDSLRYSFTFLTLFLYSVQLDVVLLLKKPVVVIDDLGNITDLLNVVKRSEACITICYFLCMYVYIWTLNIPF